MSVTWYSVGTSRAVFRSVLDARYYAYPDYYALAETTWQPCAPGGLFAELVLCFHTDGITEEWMRPTHTRLSRALKLHEGPGLYLIHSHLNVQELQNVIRDLGHDVSILDAEDLHGAPEVTGLVLCDYRKCPRPFPGWRQDGPLLLVVNDRVLRDLPVTAIGHSGVFEVL